MLKIVIPETELFNSETNEFFHTKEQALLLEHSLVSISKWESKWKKPFISRTSEKTIEETKDYIRCMTITKGVDPLVYKNIPAFVVNAVNQYINDPMTATTFREEPGAPQNNEIITAELIYYWMVSLGIPFECEKWHINKLLTLIKICSIKNGGSKKMSQRQIMASNSELNEARKRAMNSRG